MSPLLWTLIALQIVMGGIDTLGHHEATERLAWRHSQRGELRLHALRNLFYGVVLAGLATVQPLGWPALALVALLAAEFAITLRDFAEEDATRRLPVTERLLHTLLTANYGAILALLVPLLLAWSREPAALLPVWHGPWSVLCVAGALACTVLAARDWLAAARLDRLPTRPLAQIAPPSDAPKTVLVTGGTGLIGHRLVPALVQAGHRVIVLARRGNTRALQPPFTVVGALEEIGDDWTIDAVVNLAGAPLMSGPWTRAALARFRQSRIGVTRDIARLVARLHTPPSVLVQGSAVGVYGVAPDVATQDSCTERSWIEVDGSFSQRLCLDWEAEASRIPGLRTVCLRIGVVLDRSGGALGQMLVPTEFGGGTRLGTGEQRMSWISRDDLVRTVLHALDTPTLCGPVNAVTGVVRQAEFARRLARALHRPAVLRIPAFLLRRLALGRELLLADQAVRRTVPGPVPLDPDLQAFLNAHLGHRTANRVSATETRHAQPA